MSALDDDGNGQLEGNELDGLAIWKDANGNGIVDSGEIKTLADWHVKSLSCKYEWIEDDPRAVAWSQSGVTLDTGVVRPTFDVLLYAR